MQVAAAYAVHGPKTILVIARPATGDGETVAPADLDLADGRPELLGHWCHMVLKREILQPCQSSQWGPFTAGTADETMRPRRPARRLRHFSAGGSGVCVRAAGVGACAGGRAAGGAQEDLCARQPTVRACNIPMSL